MLNSGAPPYYWRASYSPAILVAASSQRQRSISLQGFQMTVNHTLKSRRHSFPNAPRAILDKVLAALGQAFLVSREVE